MARLGPVMAEAIVHHYGRDEFLRRLAHPFWFQSFGAVMGMDWHSSGITTSVPSSGGAVSSRGCTSRWSAGHSLTGSAGRARAIGVANSTAIAAAAGKRRRAAPMERSGMSHDSPISEAAAGPSHTLPEEPATGRRLRVVLNRDGGTARRLGVDPLRAQLSEGFARAGAAAELTFVPGDELVRRLEQARDDALAHGLDGIVVGGGDGSVNAAATVLAGTGVPLGVLPLGTLNHFARDLGIPPEPEAAAAAIAAAQPRPVDVAEVNGHLFVNNSLLGAYPYMVADRERRRELHGLGKWTAMSLAFLRMLARFPRRRLTLCFEGDRRPVRTPCLLVGVNEYDPQLFEVRRRHGLDEGHLWLVVAKHASPLGFAWFAFRAAFRGLVESRDFETHKLRSLEVRARTTRLPVSIDGELLRLRPPLRYRIRPGKLLVLAPPAEVT